MILVDTSVWVDHFRRADAILTALLQADEVLAHPFVIGELALVGTGQRDGIPELLSKLPQATVANVDEVLHFIALHELSGRGIGYVDVHLLASARLSSGASLWTRDKRLLGVAEQLGVAAVG